MSSTNDPSTTSSPTPDPAGEQETPGTRRHRLARRVATTVAKIAASQIVAFLVRRWLEHQL